MLQVADNKILDHKIQQIQDIIIIHQQKMSPDLLEYLELIVGTYLPMLKDSNFQEQKNTINTIINTLEKNFAGAFQPEVIAILKGSTLKPLETKIHSSEHKLAGPELKSFQSIIQNFHNKFESAMYEFNVEKLQAACIDLEEFAWEFIKNGRKNLAGLSEKMQAQEFIKQYNIYEENHKLLTKACLQMSENYLTQTQSTAFGLHAVVLAMHWEQLKLELLATEFNNKHKYLNFFRYHFLLPLPLARITPSFSASSTPIDSSLLVGAIEKIKIPSILMKDSEPSEFFWVGINEFLQGIQSLIFFDLSEMQPDALLALSKLFVEFEKACHHIIETTDAQLKSIEQYQTKLSSQSLIYQYLPIVMGTHLAIFCIKKFFETRWCMAFDIPITLNKYLIEHSTSLQERLYSLEDAQSMQSSAQGLITSLLMGGPLPSNVTIIPLDGPSSLTDLPKIVSPEEKQLVTQQQVEDEEIAEDEGEDDDKDSLTRMREGSTSMETLEMIKSSFIDPTTSKDEICENISNSGKEYLQQLELKINTASQEDRSLLISYYTKAVQLKKFYVDICTEYSESQTSSFVPVKNLLLLDLVEQCNGTLALITNRLAQGKADSVSLSSSQPAMFSSSLNSSSSSSSLSSSPSSLSESSPTNIPHSPRGMG